MLQVVALLLAAVGYVVALKLAIWLQICIYAAVCYITFNSKGFKEAELGQLLYLLALVAYSIGSIVGNIVYIAAHWKDADLMSGVILNTLTRLFTP